MNNKHVELSADVFVPAAQSSEFCAPGLGFSGTWYTWSPAARSVIRAFAERAPALPEPSRVRVMTGGIYAVTYNLEPCEALDERLDRALSALARSMRRFALPQSGLVLLKDLFDECIGGRAVHALFARLRAILARDEPDSSALYAPIEPCSVLRSAFPVHADLFPATTLLTVFNDVPDDDSGASLLLPFAAFEGLLETLGIPAQIRERVHEIRCDRGTERYDEFIDLMYRPDRPWREALLEAVVQIRHRIRFSRGEGYILDDRSWLHGREFVSVPVTPERLQRLVFAPSMVRCDDK